MKHTVCVVLMAITFLSIAGCVAGGMGIMPSNRFVYPNSNVTPLAETEGRVSKLCGVLIVQFGSPSGKDGMMATERALAKVQGADMLIDAQTEYSMTNFFLFTLCKTRVRGTAAKMEVGKQALYATNPGAPPPVQPPPGAPVPAGQPMQQPEYPSAPPPPAPPVQQQAPQQAPQPVIQRCASNDHCQGRGICQNGYCVLPR